MASTASGPMVGVPPTLSRATASQPKRVVHVPPTKNRQPLCLRSQFPSKARLIVAGVTTSLLPTSRWRPSTASATTAISSGTPPVPLPDQREAGFQRMPWVFGKPRLDLGFYRSDQII